MDIGNRFRPCDNRVEVKSIIYDQPYLDCGEDSLIVTNILCPENNHEKEKCRKKSFTLGLAIDISGSMTDHAKNLKHALNNICDQVEKLPPEECDNFHIVLVTFNETAKLTYKGPVSQNLRLAIDNISCGGKTNIGDALKLTIDNVIPYSQTCLNTHISHIIVMTDGQANEGIQTIEGLRRISATKPNNCNINTIGYTVSDGSTSDVPNPDILGAIGHYSMAESLEIVSETIGGIMGQVITTFGFNAKLIIEGLPKKKSITLRSNSKMKSRESANYRDVIGSCDVGSLFNGRKFTHAISYYVPEQKLFIDLKIRLEYFDLDGIERIVSSFYIDNGVTRSIGHTPIIIKNEAIPNNVLELYYAFSAIRLMRLKGNDIDYVNHRVDKWFPAGEEIAQNLRKTISPDYDMSKYEWCTIACIVSDLSYQTRYNDCDQRYRGLTSGSNPIEKTHKQEDFSHVYAMGYNAYKTWDD